VVSGVTLKPEAQHCAQSAQQLSPVQVGTQTRKGSRGIHRRVVKPIKKKRGGNTVGLTREQQETTVIQENKENQTDMGTTPKRQNKP